MEIKFYNSLTNKLETFVPIKKDEVSIYVCGPTVYNDPHIGNFRPAVVFDLLRRFLMSQKYNVKLVSNFTDIDDKIIRRSMELGVSEKELTTEYIDRYNHTLRDLNVLKATDNPKVSDYIVEIIDFISDLIKKGHAYASGGNVYFRVRSVKDYGLLANINIDDLQVGARIEEDTLKEDPNDFVLWKKTDLGIKFHTPRGDGRPGRHTECCVMIKSIFGPLIDIHGGGYDLKFPHHTNEIAQTEACCHTHLANYWLHNDFVVMNNEKMSKSLGNIISGNEAVAKYGGIFVRYLLLSTHYRLPLAITDEVIENAHIELDKIISTLNKLSVKSILGLGEGENKANVNLDGFYLSLADDLNISNAFSELFKVIKESNILLRSRDLNQQTVDYLIENIEEMLEVLGLNIKRITLTKEDFDLINSYEQSKKAKEFEKSDEIRKDLIKKGLF